MAVEVYIPKMSDHMESGTILRWLVEEGQAVQSGQVLFELETDKAVGEVTAPATGVLSGVRGRAGEALPVGTAVAVIVPPGEAPASSLPSAEGTGARGEVEIVPATPVARRVAKELGIDLRQVSGSGPGGRVREGDVRAQAARLEALRIADQTATSMTGLTAPAAAPPAVSGPVPASLPAVELLPLSTIQRLTGERMLESIRTIPHFFLEVDVDMTRALELREAVRGRILAETGERVSLTALLVRVAAAALRRHPRLNVSFADGQLIVHPDINIGVAVGTSGGLLAPVIHQADRKSLAEITAAIRRFQARQAGPGAEAARFSPQELSGGTFTVSNLGMFGVDRFSAIINPPQSAILAAGRIARKPLAGENDLLTVRPLMALTLSVDHRSLDGVQGAAFLAEVKTLLEQPYHLV
jgi:pyruvate dehydrogenase E2 component (dihydrolipoamide acetyltransferase)